LRSTFDALRELRLGKPSLPLGRSERRLPRLSPQGEDGLIIF